MPPQHGPDAAARWPVLTGPVPPLGAYYSPRPETGFATSGGPPEGPAPRIRAEEIGSYVLTGPGGTGKTQLAVAYAQSLWQSRDIELLVWITASSRAAILAGYAEAYARTEPRPAARPRSLPALPLALSTDAVPRSAGRG